jgi:hypothetical protein
MFSSAWNNTPPQSLPFEHLLVLLILRFSWSSCAYPLGAVSSDYLRIFT